MGWIEVMLHKRKPIPPNSNTSTVSMELTYNVSHMAKEVVGSKFEMWFSNMPNRHVEKMATGARYSELYNGCMDPLPNFVIIRMGAKHSNRETGSGLSLRYVIISEGTCRVSSSSSIPTHHQ
jgi:hypothetical protein